MSQLVLGLDIGANSIGWALLGLENGEPSKLVDLGVRVFEAGVEGDIESGKDESRAAARRQARLARRQTERRARRHRKLAGILQENGLLPDGNLRSVRDRDQALKRLDDQIYCRYDAELSGGPAHDALVQVPYFLRARALDHRLEPHELGRALYHLSQRRGFKSTRKTPKEKEKEEESVVKEAISKLESEMKQTGARTLGEYLSRLDPHQARLRGRWTSRAMYEAEFDAIWSAQARFHPALLTDDLRKAIHKAIFHQRPLKSQKGLVGRCDLEPGCKRAPMAILEAQRFRYLQKVNDLRIVTPDHAERPLTPEERAKVIDLLERHGEVSFGTLRKGLKPGKGYTFNLERGGEKRLVGNKTAAALRAVFDERWDEFTDKAREQIIEDVRSIHKDETLEKRGVRVWGLSPEKARQLARVRLEDSRCRLSRKALRKVLPLMEQGVPFKTAEKELYGERGAKACLTFLPYLDHRSYVPFDIRNPAVHRALTELRKVVNAIIHKYGKPDIIRIELARDLKRSRQERTELWKKNRQNEARRAAAAERICKEAGILSPKPDDVLRVLLAEECNWECPYTGQRITMGNLLGEATQFDIEHIIPYHRCLDNSYVNKTLCYHEENRNRKRDNTPFEAYAGNPEQYDVILERVRRFQGGKSVVLAKLRRFRIESLEHYQDYSHRQLNDTRYASTLAAQYLGLLYGGLIDQYGKRRIQAGRGEITADLRRAWGLNSIIGASGQKSREDHRHHAIDAVAIALTDAKTVKALSDANKTARWIRRAWWRDVPAPWDAFQKDVAEAVDKIVVSHRVSRKVGGPLHKETIYSRQYLDEHARPCVHVRKPLGGLTANEVEDIADPVVREMVKAKLQELGVSDPKKAFSNRANHPWLDTKDGRRIPIHRARIRKTLSTFTVGAGVRERHVVPASNHHMKILEVTDKKGGTRWEDVIVDQYTALQRLKNGQPIIQRDHGPNKRFVMSLAPGEMLELDNQDGGRSLYVVRGISRDMIEFVHANDARVPKDIKAAKEWGALRLNGVRRRNPKKVTVTPLGDLFPAND